MVRVFDNKTNEIRVIPMDELAPGMMMVNITLEDGTVQKNVWMDSNDINKGRILFTEPFTEEFLQTLAKLKLDLSEVYPLSMQQWENNFRKESAPQDEIKVWRKAADFYMLWIKPTHSLGQKKEILQIILLCTLNPSDSILKIVDLHFLARQEAGELINAFCDWRHKHKDEY
jgi:hypothetical protein